MATSSHAHCTRDLELYIRGSRGERRGERGGEREEGRERRGREEGGERGGGERRGREVWKVKTQPYFSKLRELNSGCEALTVCGDADS